MLLLHFLSNIADVEVFEDGVGEFVEFFAVNFAWGSGVDLFSGLFSPLPISVSWCIFHGFGKFFKSNLDFIVGEGFAIVGI